MTNRILVKIQRAITSSTSLNPDEIYEELIKDEDLIDIEEDVYQILLDELEKYKRRLSRSKNDKIEFPALESGSKSSGDFTLFRGDQFNQALILSNLFKKHDNACVFLPRTVKVERETKTHVDKWFLGDYEHSYESETNFPVLPELAITWDCEKNNDVKEETKCRHVLIIPDAILAMIRNCKKRFIAIPIYLSYGGDTGHANMLIYDRKTNTLERFEPHGGIHDFDDYEIDQLDRELFNFFKLFLQVDNLVYLPAQEICPFVAFQGLETKSSVLGGPGGFCSAWSLFYLDARLTYPDVPIDNLVTLLIKNIRDKKIDLTDFIRMYTNSLIQEEMKVIEPFKLHESRNFKGMTDLYLPSFLYEKLHADYERHAKMPIKVISGTPINVAYFVKGLVNEIKNEKIASIPLIVSKDSNYDKLVDYIKSSIDIYSAEYEYIIFYGFTIWTYVDKNHNRDLFETIRNVDKYFIQDIKTYYRTMVQEYFRMNDTEARFLELNNESIKILNDLFEEMTPTSNINHWIKKMLKFIDENQTRAEEFTSNLKKSVLSLKMSLQKTWASGYTNLNQVVHHWYLKNSTSKDLLDSLNYKIVEQYFPIVMIDNL